jgi:hypothetical protein
MWKIVLAVVCSIIVAFVLLVFAVDRFLLSPAPASAPVRSK